MVHNSFTTNLKDIGIFESRILEIFIFGILFYGMDCSMPSMPRSFYIGHGGGWDVGERSIEKGRHAARLRRKTGVNGKMGHLLGLFKEGKEIPSEYGGWRLLFTLDCAEKKETTDGGRDFFESVTDQCKS